VLEDEDRPHDAGNGLVECLDRRIDRTDGLLVGADSSRGRHGGSGEQPGIDRPDHAYRRGATLHCPDIGSNPAIWSRGPQLG